MDLELPFQDFLSLYVCIPKLNYLEMQTSGKIHPKWFGPYSTDCKTIPMKDSAEKAREAFRVAVNDNTISGVCVQIAFHAQTIMGLISQQRMDHVPYVNGWRFHGDLDMNQVRWEGVDVDVQPPPPLDAGPSSPPGKFWTEYASEEGEAWWYYDGPDGKWCFFDNMLTRDTDE